LSGLLARSSEKTPQPTTRFSLQDPRPCVLVSESGFYLAPCYSAATRKGLERRDGEPQPMSDAKSKLREEILKKAVIHGKVILSSGKEADYYVDLRRITLDSIAAALVGEVMLELTKDLDYDAVGGLTLGADPVATAMMHVAAQKGRRLDSFVVRKSEKAHGLQRRIEGPDVNGKRVLAVEDTSTTGGSVLTAVEALKQEGAIVVGVAVIVERGAKSKVEDAGLAYRAAFSLQDLDL